MAAGASWRGASVHVFLPCTLLHSYPGQQYAGRSGLVAPQATARFPALDSGDAQFFVLPSIACVAMSAAHWSRMISTRSRMLYTPYQLLTAEKELPSSLHYQKYYVVVCTSPFYSVLCLPTSNPPTDRFSPWWLMRAWRACESRAGSAAARAPVE